MACLPSLKTLQLRNVEFKNYEEDLLQSFLSHCPVLENLIVEHSKRDKVRKLSVPSLRRLSLEIYDKRKSADGYEIDTPSLKYFNVVDCYYNNCHLCSIANMPKLEEAYIDVKFRDIKKFLQPITSVKRLSLCLTVKSKEDVYSDGIVFNHLEHLKLCTCNTYWSNLLVRLLEDSPKLRVLKLYLNEQHSSRSKVPMVCWKNHYVPQCFVTSLEAFKWIHCGSTIFLTNSRIVNPQKKREMITECSSFPPQLQPHA